MERNAAINHILNRLDQKFSDFMILNSTNLSMHNAAYIKDYILGNYKAQTITVIIFIDNYFENEVVILLTVVPESVYQDNIKL
jgi:hypothetical protein